MTPELQPIGICRTCGDKIYVPFSDHVMENPDCNWKTMKVNGDYHTFLDRKSQIGGQHGFDPLWMPDFLFDFQKALVEWALRKGRAAIFADCGLGKTPIQLVWARNVIARSPQARVLILTPLGVCAQTIREAEKFGIEDCRASRDGKLSGPGSIIVTNYEKLHLFSPNDFAAVVCDESSILKHFSGSTQKAITRFMSKIPYRLLCTATAAPNDYYELGTSSEALGELGYSDMLTRFFKMNDHKTYRMNDVKLARDRQKSHYAKLAYRVSQQIGMWQLKPHAEIPFWRWICSWARACRKPTDLGFDDSQFELPPLIENQHTVIPKKPSEGMLFVVPAFGLKEERDERRRTLQERCEYVAQLADHNNSVVVWCHLNAEADLLEKIISDAIQVKGGDSDEKRERIYEDFRTGIQRILVVKPKIAAWGVNWQHCAHVITFASHSYEQYYQSIRRCWRFGQEKPVTVDVISTEAEVHVRENMLRKSQAAARMFDALVMHMNEATKIHRQIHSTDMEVPSWL